MTEDQGGGGLKASDLMKKVLTVGVGALFLTEESLRGMISEFKLPKEILSGVLDSANKTRKEFLQNLSHEVMDRIMERVDIGALIDELVSKNDIELTVKMRFAPKKSSQTPKD